MFNKTFITGLLIINMGACGIASSTNHFYVSLIGGILTMLGGFFIGYSVKKEAQNGHQGR